MSLAALLAGCANEVPFTDPSKVEATGSLMTSCLAPKLTGADGVEVSTRATVPSTDDFNVVITRKSKSRETAAGSLEYKYSDMPEVLTLPADDYMVYAHHGDNKPAAWDEPYYYGESEFKIAANKITDDVDPIVAKLANIRVTIVFHSSLLGAMSGNSKVEVKVGDQMLQFTPDEKRSAYFKYLAESQTLAATFTGMVDGTEVSETKTHDNVAPGNHYRITFRLRGIEEDDPGTVSAGISVDATVEQVNMNHTVNGEPEEILTDNERPNQGGNKEPGPGPDDPTPPTGDGNAPSAEALEPSGDYAGFDKLDLTKANEISDHLYCAWQVTSEAEGGFSTFLVDIISDTLTPGELSSVGLTDHLDLITPKGKDEEGKDYDYEEALGGLGFPINVGGDSEAEFDITGFLSLMAALGVPDGKDKAEHEFKLTVGDANGISVFTIKLFNK